TLLGQVPRWRIHQHPLLALWYALGLNKDAATQHRAAPFFASAVLVSKLAPRAAPLERATLAGIESAAQRLLGHPQQMKRSARQALALFQDLVDDPGRRRDFDELLMTSISQSAASLFYADELEEALEARLLHARFAESKGQPH